MSASLTRRAVLLGTVVAAPAVLAAPVSGQTTYRADAQSRLADLEAKSGGRLGISALDTSTGRRFEHRAKERFALCSTFKFLAVAMLLTRVDRGHERLDRRITFKESDIVTYSPVTKDRAGPGGMTLAEICEAALTLSDNTAGNLLLANLGGPAGLTAYLRSLGDDMTRLDRIEPDLNEATPGDPRDTTTPAAMLEHLNRFVLGQTLSKASRDQLVTWLLANKTGDKRLRAGMPRNWRVGDKTGSGYNGATNDIAVIWRPDRTPFIISAFYAEAAGRIDDRSAVLARVGRIIAASV